MLLRTRMLLVLVMVMLDQLAKFIAVHFFLGLDIAIIPGLISLAPYKNTSLGAIFILFGVSIPIIYAIYIILLAIPVGIIGYKYLSYLSVKNRIFINLFLTYALAAVCCVFIDAVFWGGSWDYIGLFDTVIIDLKDIYIVICEVCLFIWLITYIPQYFKMCKAERKQFGFLLWLKKGCPVMNEYDSGNRGKQ